MITQVAPSGPIEFSVTEAADSDVATIVSVTGEVDILTAPQLGVVLNRLLAEDRSVIIDLSAVTFLDSSGLAVLLRANQASRGAGSAFRLAAPLPEAVARLFEMTSVMDLFAFERTD